MLQFRVFAHTEPRRAERISRSPALPFLSRIPAPRPLPVQGDVDRRFRPCRKGSPNFNRINIFADLHFLTPIESIFYKNIGEGGCHVTSTFRPSDVPTCFDLSSFLSHSCALFCAFLHLRKIQLFSFQAFPHSSSKNTRWGRRAQL
jgi:hypothetical protein